MDNYDANMIFARQSGTCYRNGRPYRCTNRWNSWGRWVALAVIVIAALVLFFLIACCSSRRRRKAGRQPFYGTGWAGNVRPFQGGHQPQYNPNYNTQQPQYGQQGRYGQQGGYGAAPPNYNQSTGGGYGGQPGGEAQSYFGGQRGDVEMNGAGGGFAPPPGPPPGKDHVVR